jgi:phage terminase large subunit GpA-like protein
LKPSEWAEEFFVLPEKGNAEPGKFRFSRTPYLRGVVDAFIETGVEEIVFVSGTRVGKTTASQIQLGYRINNDPGSTLMVMPSESAAEERVKDKIRPVLQLESVRQHLSPDPHKNTLSRIELDSMDIYTGWAGSPQSLGDKTCRYVDLDEVDKFPPFAGREADPISLAKERTGTYGHRRRHYITSTPTTREGAIWKAWEGCGDRRHYHVPCPHCQTMQRLVWDRVKWPRLAETDPIKRADEIERAGMAWYECESCKGRIEESHKPKMLEAGEWRNETGSKSKRVGFHLSSLYSPWRSFASMAAEFIRAEGDLPATMNFRNSRLAEPFENVVKAAASSAIRDRLAAAPMPGTLPDWATAIFATADTQKDWFKLHIRAWGGGYRSQLLLEAVCNSFDELYNLAFSTKFGTATANYLLIDSGGTKNDDGSSRTNEVYEFSQRDPGRILPTKGASNPMRRPWNMTTLPSGVNLYMIDTQYFKDMLARLISDPDQTKWQIHRGVSDGYISEMGNEHKIIDRANHKMSWQKKTSGARVEAWDCEVLQCAAADMANLGTVELQPIKQPPAATPQTREPAGGNWLTSHKGRY